MLKLPKPKDLLSLFLLFITMACLNKTAFIHASHPPSTSWYTFNQFFNSSWLLSSLSSLLPACNWMTEKAAQSVGNQTVRPHRKASLLDQPNRMKDNNNHPCFLSRKKEPFQKWRKTGVLSFIREERFFFRLLVWLCIVYHSAVVVGFVDNISFLDEELLSHHHHILLSSLSWQTAVIIFLCTWAESKLCPMMSLMFASIDPSKLFPGGHLKDVETWCLWRRIMRSKKLKVVHSMAAALWEE